MGDIPTAEVKHMGGERSRESPLVHIPNFIQVTRDSGYRNTATALAEFIDNSIEAEATRINIDLRTGMGA